MKISDFLKSLLDGIEKREDHHSTSNFLNSKETEENVTYNFPEKSFYMLLQADKEIIKI